MLWKERRKEIKQQRARLQSVLCPTTSSLLGFFSLYHLTGPARQQECIALYPNRRYSVLCSRCCNAFLFKLCLCYIRMLSRTALSNSNADDSPAADSLATVQKLCSVRILSFHTESLLTLIFSRTNPLLDWRDVPPPKGSIYASL